MKLGDYDEAVRARLPDLLRYATALSGDPHLAADVVQEVLVRAHKHWDRIDDPDRYLRRMVTNEYLSWRRRWHTRSVVPVDDDVLHGRAPRTPDPAAQVADRDDLRQRLGRLPRRQRAVLVLRFYEGLSDPEIADLLDVSASTVRAAASRALATLREGAVSMKGER